MGKAKADARSLSGRTALHFACRHGHAPVSELLILRGAGSDLQDESGRTPLFEAAAQGHVSCVATLLQFGHYANVSYGGQVNPLSVARRKGHARIVSLLVPLSGTYCDLGKNACTPAGGQSHVEDGMKLIGGVDLLLGGEL